MISVAKNVAGIASSFFLALSLSPVVQAADRLNPTFCADRTGQPGVVKCTQATPQGIHTIQGEISRIKGANLLVKRPDGEEVHCLIDLTTQMSGRISPGQRIEAEVNGVEEEQYVLSIRQIELRK